MLFVVCMYVLFSLVATRRRVSAPPLSNVWVVHPNWVTSCKVAGAFVHEGSFGNKYADNPFKGKTFMVSGGSCLRILLCAAGLCSFLICFFFSF